MQRQLYQHWTRHHKLNPSNRHVEAWKPNHSESVSNWISFTKTICGYNEIDSYYTKLQIKTGIPIFLQVKCSFILLPHCFENSKHRNLCFHNAHIIHKKTIVSLVYVTEFSKSWPTPIFNWGPESCSSCMKQQ